MPHTADWSAGSASRLRKSIAAQSAAPAGPFLRHALTALGKGDHASAAAQASLALAAGGGVLAHRLSGLAREGQGDLTGAFESYQAAHDLAPDEPDLLPDLGRLAVSLGVHQVAAGIYRLALQAQPESQELTVALARALREGHDYDGAIAVLRPALEAHPDRAKLWDALGCVMLQQGDLDKAQIFFDQAVSLAPDWSEAFYDRAGARREAGDFAGALADCRTAADRAAPHERAAINFLRALVELGQGELRAGWKDYEARLDPSYPKAPDFQVPLPRLAPTASLTGKRLLVVGEQGLGDEVMFATVLPDLIAALGEEAALSLAVEPRLVPLFSRSFPRAEVFAHSTSTAGGRPIRGAQAGRARAWIPIGSLPMRLRRDLASFADQPPALKPDPGRVAHWRTWLTGLPGERKLGLTWKSMKIYGERRKQFPPFAALAPILSTPGLALVNLQYGDCEIELAAARAAGAPIHVPPGLDLTNDLDDLAALAAALDLVAGVGNASSNIAAAVGTSVWMIAPPAGWIRLAQDHDPWFPRNRVFVATSFGEWEPPVAALAAALASGE